MCAARCLTADRQVLEKFKSQIPKGVYEKDDESRSTLPLHIFEWSEGAPQGSERVGVRSIDDVYSRNHPTVRAIFAPRDIPSPHIGYGLHDLFQRCNIPSDFIEEGLQHVSQSFAARKDVNGITYVWSHFLLKDVALENGQIVHRSPTEANAAEESQALLQAQAQSQANFTWLRPSFVLKIQPSQRSPPSPPVPARRTTSSSSQTLTSGSMEPRVELFCFGAPERLRDRFQKLKDMLTCEDILQDPYMLLEVFLSELQKVMDQTGWCISEVFGRMETHTLGMAKTPGKITKKNENLDFAGLHNLFKHCIYLRENCESALATLSDLRDAHKATLGDNPNAAQESTKQSLKYLKTLFQSTQRRLVSLDARMSNMIQLSFHIVTQGDSRLMQSESQSMKTIAVMTLVFMPLSTVATIFGTQFIRQQEESPNHITVSQDFWLLWVIAVPLTVLVVTLWRVWYADAKGRLIDDIPPDAARGMGWKTLRQTIRLSEQNKQGRRSAGAGASAADAKV